MKYYYKQLYFTLIKLLYEPFSMYNHSGFHWSLYDIKQYQWTLKLSYFYQHNKSNYYINCFPIHSLCWIPLKFILHFIIVDSEMELLILKYLSLPCREVQERYKINLCQHQLVKLPSEFQCLQSDNVYIGLGGMLFVPSTLVVKTLT